MAQTLNTAYFMKDSYFRTNLNPALTTSRGYVAIPILSGIGLEANSNFLSVDNFFYQKDGQVVTALHSSVSADEFLSRLPNVGKMSLSANLNIFGAGFYHKKMFWNFGVNLRQQGDLALSKDIFSVLKTLGNGSYSLSESALSSNTYSEIYVGTTYPILDWLTVGGRVKFLVGILNASAQFDEMSASVTPENIYGNLRGAININAPIIALEGVMPGDVLSFSEVINARGAMRLGSMGAAIDLGTEMSFLNNNLRVSAAVTDLGFIKWSKTTSAVADLSGKFYFNGMNFATAEPDYGYESSMTIAEATTTGYTTMLNCSLNIGAEYNILNDRIGFGLLSHTEFCNTAAYSELTISANFRPLKWLSGTISHTLLAGTKAGIFGLALNIHTRGFNLFLGTDYLDTSYVKYKSLSVPRRAKDLNAYIGIGFNIGK